MDHEHRDDIDDVANLIDEFVRDKTDDLLGICHDLTACNSINPPGSTVETAQVIQDFFKKNGVKSELLSLDVTKPNLVSTIESHKLGKHLILNGHMDTVSPGNQSDWSIPLFKGTNRNGKMMGLGLGNMKAGTAALALATLWLHLNKKSWMGKVTYTAVADETIFGENGADWLLSKYPNLIGDAVICGEGAGQMNTALAEKGLLWIEIEAITRSGQGMLANVGTSAIAKISRIISQLDQWNKIISTAPEELDYLHGESMEEGLRLSVNIGEIIGGHFISQIATTAKTKVDIRIPPGLTVKEITAKLDNLCASEDNIYWRVIKGWNPSWTSQKTKIAKSISRAKNIFLSEATQSVVRLPASDASRWRSLGVPAVCIGPQPELVSGVDDYAWISDIVNSAKIYALSAWVFLNSNQ